MKNYRPVYNFASIPKPIVSVVTRRIEDHLEHNDVHDNYKHAYCRGHLDNITGVVYFAQPLQTYITLVHDSLTV